MVVAEPEANSYAPDSAILFIGAERETPYQEEPGASQQAQLRHAQALRVRGYHRGTCSPEADCLARRTC